MKLENKVDNFESVIIKINIFLIKKIIYYLKELKKVRNIKAKL
jgi:hypothetical protein